MSRNNKTFAIAYTLLVILPVTGMLAILKQGRKLTAPVSVSGVWRLRSDLAGLPCAKSLASLQDVAIVVSQSGKDLTLNWMNAQRTTTSGAINGTTLTASVLPFEMGPSEAGCGISGPLLLTATVDVHSSPRSLSGTASAIGCPECPAVSVSGVKQDIVAEKNGG
jgi:hypothetical protein